MADEVINFVCDKKSGPKSVFKLHYMKAGYERHEFDPGKDFNPAKGIFPCDFPITTGFNWWHFKIWATARQEDPADYGWMTFLPTVDPKLTFSSEDSRDAFIEWMARYETRYPDGQMHKCKIPELQPGPVKGILFPRPQLSEGMLVEHWAWMADQCAGGIQFSREYILFENDTDAVAYKMNWTGKGV